MVGGLVKIDPMIKDITYYNITKNIKMSPVGTNMKSCLERCEVFQEHYGININTELLVPLELL